MTMLSANIGILNAAGDLVITHEEVKEIMHEVFLAAIIGGMLVYMIMAFGKGIGLKREEETRFVEVARRM